MYKSYKTPWAIMLFATILLLAACASGGFLKAAQPVEGMITNYETGEPVPDAFVVARWTGTSGGLGHSGGAICFHVEVTRTDAEGQYFIPPPKIRPEYADYRKPRILITAYKPGYRRPYWVNDVPSPTDQLIDSDETPHERISYLLDVRKNISCMQAGESEQNLLVIYKSLYTESVRFAETKDEKITAFSLLQNIESIELGGDEASKRFYERLKELQ
ncbi:MAG: carboxypeptidase-like regulatory domain-containing protein [Gammaproteobacteria bacterium]